MLTPKIVGALALTALATCVLAGPEPALAQTSAAPQTVTPAPLPPGTADTPGGAARNGVIAPPAPAADPGIIRGTPPASTDTPVIPPPGSPGGNPTVIPK